jgi:hypothetical protein
MAGETLDLPAQRRLGDMKRIGSGRHGPGVEHCQKVLKTFKVHASMTWLRAPSRGGLRLVTSMGSGFQRLHPYPSHSRTIRTHIERTPWILKLPSNDS